MQIKLEKGLLIGTFLHGTLLLILTFYWLSLPNIYSDEAFFIKWTSLIKKSVFQIDPKPNPSEVLFIDISSNKAVVPIQNEFDELSDWHRKVIVDRHHLGRLLEVIEPYKDRVKHVFMDVLFEEKSPHDSFFIQKASAFKDKLLISARIDKQGNYHPPLIDVPSAVSTYETSQGLFLKYRLKFQDSLSTGPLTLLQRLDGAQVERKYGVNWVNGALALPTPIVDLKVRPKDFQISNTLNSETFAVHKLGTLLELAEFMDATDIEDFFVDKLIILGDFDNQTHNTVFGSMSGPLIFYNSYLTLKGDAYLVKMGWVLFMLVCYWFLSHVCFGGVKIKWNYRFFKPQKEWLEETINESIILVVITVLSYALFGIHINILIIIVYLTVVTYLWQLLTKKKQPKKATDE